MRVALGSFARAAIEAHLGDDLVTEMQSALRQYARRLKSAARPAEFPSFRLDSRPEASGTALDVPVDREILVVMEEEVQRQGASVDQLAAHAVLVFLAERDRGCESPTLPG